ncbi:ABC-type multidrug transport system ATPase component [Furfurilactobacillus rossiae]|uniref:ABC superfamily ATP binding cassette transporter, ABC protein n=2 Tax=Furfurilactobacillus rossiae TaxID=231049 RepID=A0A0R1RJS0_9LACO|nr:ABC superfamily ATP binding cassette transporter, ABC protein [Furfurilactobacillus rossiae DSM 15814]QLE60263.1 ABC-type multidrug transport system ATPase component [Furfurilactobacillus rossiae]
MVYVEGEEKMTEIALQLQHVSKRFGKHQALDDVDLTINRGDIYGLIGENGAGKTTIMRLITGLSPLQKGTITLLGQTSGPKYRETLNRVGTIIEAPAFFPHLTVMQNLRLVAKQKGIVNPDEVDDTIELVGLSEKEKSKAQKLSLGQRQRLGLGIALLGKPDLLILDEPINGLDPEGIIEFRRLLKQLNQASQMTILISSHILTELYQVSTRFGFIHRGRLIKEIDKTSMDEANQSGLMVHVDNVDTTSQVLDRLRVGKFTVIDDKHVMIYNLVADAGLINRELLTAGVRVSEIERREGSLESYYTQLITDANKQEAN